MEVPQPGMVSWNSRSSLVTAAAMTTATTSYLLWGSIVSHLFIAEVRVGRNVGLELTVSVGRESTMKADRVPLNSCSDPLLLGWRFALLRLPSLAVRRHSSAGSHASRLGVRLHDKVED